MTAFERLQARLAGVLALNSPGSSTPHVVVMMPSFSVGPTLLAHYRTRIPALEHRYLLAVLVLARVPGAEMVVVVSQEPPPDVLDYCLRLVPARLRDDVAKRFRLAVAPDPAGRSVAAKLLDRPGLLAELKASFAGRPAFIEPWNVTDDEVAVALALDAPVNGTDPALLHLGFKSAGRRLFADVGVPVPEGVEGVRTTDDVLAAVRRIRSRCPRVDAVVVKHDDSVAGDGNAVIELVEPDGSASDERRVRDRVAGLPDWYRRDLARGGVVEQRVGGPAFSSPSAQVDIRGDGSVVVLSTHEQVLGGPAEQVYLGCRFPADHEYAGELARHAEAVGERLARLGARGRVALDFAACRGADGRRQVRALEINLRKGGTTHPYLALRNLVPGHYDAAAGRWVATDGSTRVYTATDNLQQDDWLGLPPAAVVDAVEGAGLAFDHARGTGVVLHMLTGLAVDGRFGAVAIGRTRAESDDLLDRLADAVRAEAAVFAPSGSPTR